jgi:uncharacterized membrane protein YhaH (DUF805 family)
MHATSQLEILMTWIRFVFGWTGRIGRLQYCLSLLTVVGICATVLLLALALAMLVGATPQFAVQADVISFAIAVIVFVAFMIGFAAIMSLGIKRLHDRGKSGLWVYVFYGLPALIVLGDERGHVEWQGTAAAITILLWGLGELCCLRGTIGANKYGPDPHGDQQLHLRWRDQRPDAAGGP